MIGGKGKKAVKKPVNADEAPPIDIMADLTAEVDLGDEDIEVDENDPDLLGELLELTQADDRSLIDEEEPSESEPEDNPPSEEPDVLSLLKERLKMYKTAEAKAKENNESSRARRFSRGIKTLEDLLKKAKAGKAVSPNDIPPAIALNLKPAPPPPPPTVQTPMSQEENGSLNEESGNSGDSTDLPNLEDRNSNSTESNTSEDMMTTLMERLQMYQTAEGKAKESGETTRARRFNRGIKTIETLIMKIKAGESVSTSDIPPMVALNLKPPPPQTEDDTAVNTEDAEDEVNTINLETTGEEASDLKEEEEPERNIMDILSERLRMYQTAEEKANEAGESTRARRFNRGQKTLRELIRKATAGIPIPPNDIPPPIALNLKPQPVVAMQEEEPQDSLIENENLVQSSDTRQSPIKFSLPEDEDIDLDEILEEEEPKTVMEGLEQRLKIYRKLLERAQNEGNEMLATQNEKIVKIYMNAIRTFKNGGYVDVLKLPTPKGCPPIPIPFHIP